MKIIGLTGGIGSGKSTVAQFFKNLGVPIYIADEAAKKIMETSVEVRQEILALFGKKAYEGSKPNRPFIASKVFQDKKLLDSLNKIIHPRVRENFESWLGEQSAPYVIYEAAILFENGGETRCDLTILVTAPKEDRIKRLLIRDQTDRAKIEARMAAQWSDDRKKELADFHIENSQLELTKIGVQKLHKSLLRSINS